MVGHKLEEADRVYIVDTVAAPGTPGTCIRYAKEDFLLKRIPIKLSPHQVGVQEMLQVSLLRGRCPDEIYLLGIIPSSLAPGTELSPLLQQRLPELAVQLVSELSASPAPNFRITFHASRPLRAFASLLFNALPTCRDFPSPPPHYPPKGLKWLPPNRHRPDGTPMRLWHRSLAHRISP
jgi:hydrogenase maturation protease